MAHPLGHGWPPGSGRGLGDAGVGRRPRQGAELLGEGAWHVSGQSHAQVGLSVLEGSGQGGDGAQCPGGRAGSQFQPAHDAWAAQLGISSQVGL